MQKVLWSSLGKNIHRTHDSVCHSRKSGNPSLMVPRSNRELQHDGQGRFLHATALSSTPTASPQMYRVCRVQPYIQIRKRGRTQALKDIQILIFHQGAGNNQVIPEFNPRFDFSQSHPAHSLTSLIPEFQFCPSATVNVRYHNILEIISQPNPNGL